MVSDIFTLPPEASYSGDCKRASFNGGRQSHPRRRGHGSELQEHYGMFSSCGDFILTTRMSVLAGLVDGGH